MYSVENIKIMQTRVLSAYEGGKSLAQISRDADVAKSTIYLWLNNDVEFKKEWDRLSAVALEEAAIKRIGLAQKQADIAGEALDNVDPEGLSVQEAFGLADTAIENLGEVTGQGTGKQVTVNVNPPKREPVSKEEMDKIQKKLGG